MTDICLYQDCSHLTSEEQFAIDSMSVITDDELLTMQLVSIDSVLSFIEQNSRKKRMERLEPGSRRVFIERTAERNRRHEEKLLKRKMEMERLRREERNRRRRERRQKLKMLRIEEMERLRRHEEEERIKAYMETERLRLEENLRKQDQEIQEDTYLKYEPESQEQPESKPRKELGFFSRCILVLKSLRGFATQH